MFFIQIIPAMLPSATGFYDDQKNESNLRERAEYWLYFAADENKETLRPSDFHRSRLLRAPPYQWPDKREKRSPA